MTKALIDFSRWLTEAMGVLWTYRVIAASLLVLYGALWQMDQGQDLLVNLNDSHLGVAVFVAVISMIAALFWHLPKYLSKKTTADFSSLRAILKEVFNGTVGYDKKAEKDLSIARLLGVIVFLIPAFAVLNVLDKYGIPTPDPFWLFIITVVFYSLLFHFNWIEKTYEDAKEKPQRRHIFHAVILGCVLCTFLFALFNHGRPRDLYWLSAGLCLMSLAFAVSVSIRRHLDEGLIIGWLKKQLASRWVMISSGTLATFFVLMNFFPFSGAPWPFFTISVLLCGLVSYVFLFTFLLLWSRVTKIDIATGFIIVALALAIYSNNPFHEIRQVERTVQPERLSKHLAGWLMHRKNQIDRHTTEHPYPIFIINAYGGGLRAAAWTSLTVQRLDSAVNKFDSLDSFQGHVLAYSGASGGTIGSSVLCTLKASHHRTTQGELKRFYRRNFLSPVLIGLIGRDCFFSSFGSVLAWFGMKMDDRAVLQEKMWEAHMEDFFQSAVYSSEFSALYQGDSTFEVPLLLANTTEIKKGLKGIVSPMDLDSSDFKGALSVNRLLRGRNNFRLSTAAFMSARFPGISPAGKMDTANYFMDGGLKENSGAETARQLKEVMERVMLADVSIQGKVKIYLLSLPNTVAHSPEIRRKQIVQLTAPLQALETNWEGNTRVADSLNHVLFSDAIFTLRPTNSPLRDEAGPYKAVLPLGWQLSEKALQRMENSLIENQPTIDRILRTF